MGRSGRTGGMARRAGTAAGVEARPGLVREAESAPHRAGAQAGRRFERLGGVTGKAQLAGEIACRAVALAEAGEAGPVW